MKLHTIVNEHFPYDDSPNTIDVYYIAVDNVIS